MALHTLFDVTAPAKLNLFLHVTGRRPDGYHLLQSAMVLIDWHDTLHFERRDDAVLARHDLGATLPADDLCLRAARLLQREAGSHFGADISIDKRVPWGAGLGGGSSDAASTLLALNRLWGLDWPLERLLPLGLRLGADLPFFLAGQNAWVEGIGERITPLGHEARSFAVVKPAACLATRAVFERVGPIPHGRAVIVAGFIEAGFGRNDLQPAAQGLCPAVANVGQWLQGHFGNSRMTGSGSAVFANVDDAIQTLPALEAGWIGRICRSLTQHPLRGWAD
ncbi:MAG: 4-(cytidine 5'-diphospho)-2-C-methyl-D-erythritol kinase [Burkholderiaceae bacterium]